MMFMVRRVLPLLAAGALGLSACANRDNELFQATTAGDPAAVSAAVEAGADPDAMDAASGWTPLMLAISRNDRPTVQALLAAGANPNVQVGKAGTTALA